MQKIDRVENEAGESKGGALHPFAYYIGRQCRPKMPCLSGFSPFRAVAALGVVRWLFNTVWCKIRSCC